MVGEHLASVQEADRYIAHRTAIDPRDPTKSINLPGAIVRAAEAHRRPGHAFDELLIVADAGEGKTTLVHSLLCALTEPADIERWRLVPMLADCVTLYRLFAADDDEKRVVDRWLTLAIAPARLRQEQPDSAAVPDARVNDFMAAVREARSRILLLIDGFDELNPSAMPDRLGVVTRLFRALHDWEDKHSLDQCLLVATTRPYFEGLERLSNMRLVRLQPPTAREVRNLATASGVSAAGMELFLETFQDEGGIAAKYVYFWPLRRFKQHLDASLLGRAGPSRSG